MVIGIALLGVALGAAGAEFLRAKRPDLVAKIEKAAKNVVDSMGSSKSDNETTPEN